MDITDVGIIGASTRGRGLAEALSLAGFNLTIVEIDKDTLERGFELIEEEMDALIAKWGLTESEKKAALARIKGVTCIDEINRDAQLVFVTVQEDLDLNKGIFSTLDEIMNPDCLFVSHTAILSITEIANATNRPDKIAGVVFLPPVTQVKVAEVVCGLHTSKETFLILREFIQVGMSKTPIQITEFPGNITIRMLVSMINEALCIAMEGTATIDDIDTAMKLGYKMNRGPFELGDKIGLDLVSVWMDYLFKELGIGSGAPHRLISKLVRAGHLGLKTRRGFYVYDEQGKISGLGALNQLKRMESF